MLSGVGVFSMEMVLNSLKTIDKSPRGIQIYVLAISCYGFIACSVAYFFPYRDNNAIEGFALLSGEEEKVIEPYIPTPETGRKVLPDTNDDGNLNRSAEPSFSSAD